MWAQLLTGRQKNLSASSKQKATLKIWNSTVAKWGSCTCLKWAQKNVDKLNIWCLKKSHLCVKLQVNMRTTSDSFVLKMRGLVGKSLKIYTTNHIQRSFRLRKSSQIREISATFVVLKVANRDQEQLSSRRKCSKIFQSRSVESLCQNTATQLCN